MKIAYFDCFSGISGAKVLGALLDLGIDFEKLQYELAKLPLTEYAMSAKPVTRGGVSATKVSIKTIEKGLVRTFGNIRQIIVESGLKPSVKERSLMIFQSLAQAQAKINRKSLEAIHFHEVGAIDSIVDIVGSAIGFNMLKVDQVYCSPLPMGLGMVRTEHGMLPIPSPVTLEILSGVPIYTCNIQSELVTPTGAAIARSFVHEFGNMPNLTVEHVGYGAGRQDLDIPNVMRLITGELNETGTAIPITHITATVENMSQAKLTKILNKLKTVGATDIWTRPVSKVKNKDSIELNLVASIDKEESLAVAIFAETQAENLRITRQSMREREKK